MRRALFGLAALGSLALMAACGSDDDDVDTSVPSVESILDPIAPEDSAGPVDSSVTGDTMTPVPVDSSMTGNSGTPMDTTMTSDTPSSATVAP